MVSLQVFISVHHLSEGRAWTFSSGLKVFTRRRFCFLLITDCCCFHFLHVIILLFFSLCVGNFTYFLCFVFSIIDTLRGELVVSAAVFVGTSGRVTTDLWRRKNNRRSRFFFYHYYFLLLLFFPHVISAVPSLTSEGSVKTV